MFLLFDPKSQMKVEARGRNMFSHWSDTSTFKTVSAAKAARTRLKNRAPTAIAEGIDLDYWGQDFDALDIITGQAYNIIMDATMEEVINLMSGKPVLQRRDTPLSCDVSSERYWSM